MRSETPGGLFVVSLLLIAAVALISCTKHHDPYSPRVPDHKMEEAKNLKAPFGDARKAPPDIVAEGKQLFEGRGACFHCHGTGGKGDGAAATKSRLHPPRDFTSCKWHDARTDGELFWVLDHGSPGTAMVDQVPHKLSEEQAWKVVAYLRTLCVFK